MIKLTTNNDGYKAQGDEWFPQISVYVQALSRWTIMQIQYALRFITETVTKV
ncbi:hypothetical protein [Flagellimonas sp.]|uniref:hypothetical protein n=1 Tax=Flagellimonas sp. TaxID=2058762 RepID=UPI003BAD21AD